MLSPEEKEELVSSYPEAEKIIKKLVGSREFINAIEKWCLWIDDADLQLAQSIPPILERIENVRISRENGGGTARRCSHRPHQFEMTRSAVKSQIILPKVSSERRKYIPTGFLDSNTVVTCKAQVLYDSEPYVFGIINSRMHMIWVRTVSSRMRSDYQYQVGLVYNTFPIKKLSQNEKENLTKHVFNLLEIRELFPQKSLAQLYDPDKMPESLREAHEELDLALERCYRSKPFTSDEERLEHLFKLYEEMTSGKDAK